MPQKKLFDKPFDDGTKAKLEVFKRTFMEWLPVFVAREKPIWSTVQVFDFFAGQGKDSAGEPGSPLLLIDIVKSLEEHIIKNNIRVILHFNELDPQNFHKLCSNLVGITGKFEIRIYNKKFQELFNELYSSMQSTANFIFLDQNGIKEITTSIFKQITALKKTDFLFFISSSYFKRFANTPEFTKYFSLNIGDLQEISYYHIHRKVLEHYESLIETGKSYFLAPFSIKKGKNIYGLIFGTNHTFGIEKFLTVAWKIDPLTGEANYNIDNERIDLKSPFLFDELNIPTKRLVFEDNLTKNILNGTLKTDIEIYLYTLKDGFLLKDANLVLKNLSGISYDFSLITSGLHKIKNGSPIKLR